MGRRGEVLVAIVNNLADLAVAREQGWYRIPEHSQHRFLQQYWPPQWLAFYQTRVFGKEAFQINYFARVGEIGLVPRRALFPDTPDDHPKAGLQYFQLMLEPLRRLPKPIVARRQRRVLFIPTTWDKFANALEINDLWDESDLDDKLWALFQRANAAIDSS